MLPAEYWIIVVVTAIAVIACVVVHYEGLRALGNMKIGGMNDRSRIICMILCILALHIVEVWIFGAAYYYLLADGELGGLHGIETAGIFDYVYFSATVYSTLGFGDIVPSGGIRFVTGTESITGLTLITWSASFTFVEMMGGREHNHE